jgi:hypothetical protein
VTTSTNYASGRFIPFSTGFVVAAATLTGAGGYGSWNGQCNLDARL